MYPGGPILFVPNLTRDRVEPDTECAVDHTRSRRNTGTKPAGICVQKGHRALLPPLKGDNTMTADYDAPRRTETDDVPEDSLEDLKARRNEAQLAVVDVDESESAESFELPAADLSAGELSVRVIPKKADGST